MARPRLESEQFADGGKDVFGLGEDFIFEFGLVGAESVHGGDTAHWSVEILKQLIGDAGGDFGAVAPGERVFVGHDNAAGFPDA